MIESAELLHADDMFLVRLFYPVLIVVAHLEIEGYARDRCGDLYPL